MTFNPMKWDSMVEQAFPIKNYTWAPQALSAALTAAGFGHVLPEFCLLAVSW